MACISNINNKSLFSLLQQYLLLWIELPPDLTIILPYSLEPSLKQEWKTPSFLNLKVTSIHNLDAINWIRYQDCILTHI